MSRVFTHTELAEKERLVFFLLWYHGIKVMLRLPYHPEKCISFGCRQH